MKQPGSVLKTQLPMLVFLLCQLNLVAFAETIRIGLAMPRDMKEVEYITGMYHRFKEEVETASGRRAHGECL